TFNGFNLLVGDIESIEYISNRRESDHVFSETLTEPGIYTLSNHLLNTPWPKTVSLRETFTKAIVQNETVDLRDYIELLQSTETYDQERLPNTGIPSELEQKLSPIFIVGNEYGTRSSTAIKFNKREHSIQILEVQYDSDGAANQNTRLNFAVNHH
ncbi:MAG: NRDE family protein, partial [Betaproteobacteria bacterium]